METLLVIREQGRQIGEVVKLECWTYQTRWEIGMRDFDNCFDLMKHLLLKFDNEDKFYF